jgi:hypothetical protein
MSLLSGDALEAEDEADPGVAAIEAAAAAGRDVEDGRRCLSTCWRMVWHCRLLVLRISMRVLLLHVERDKRWWCMKSIWRRLWRSIRQRRLCIGRLVLLEFIGRKRRWWASKSYPMIRFWTPHSHIDQRSEEASSMSRVLEHVITSLAR